MHWLNYSDQYGHGFMGFGPFGMIIFWIFFIMVIIFIVRAFSGKSPRHPVAETPLEILKRRYAAGEITAQEFKEMKAEILH